MRLSERIPTNIVAGILIFLGLVFGGYFVGRTNAVSTSPTYVTDSSGSNAASVNAQGHLSVHLADPALPAYRGPYAPRRITIDRPALSKGQCYVAFTNGAADLLTAGIQARGSGKAPPTVVRLDRSLVWLENGSGGDAALGIADGVTAVGHGYIFGFSYPLFFKTFGSIEACWFKSGHSAPFQVQLRVSGEGGGDVSPQQLLFATHAASGKITYTWQLLEGPIPVGFRLYGTNSTQATFFSGLPISEVLSQPNLAATYSASVPSSAVSTYRRVYLFEMWSAGTPTRIGPFGSWSGL